MNTVEIVYAPRYCKADVYHYKKWTLRWIGHVEQINE